MGGECGIWATISIPIWVDLVYEIRVAGQSLAGGEIGFQWYLNRQSTVADSHPSIDRSRPRPAAIPGSEDHGPPLPPCCTRAGAAPWALPRVFFAFLAVAMPWRFYDFVFRHRGYNLFYLFDFCYWVNAAVAWYLAGGAAGWDLPHLSAALYSLADGPVACALAAWRCRWTFGSADHTTRYVSCVCASNGVPSGWVGSAAHVHTSVQPAWPRLGRGRSHLVTVSACGES